MVVLPASRADGSVFLKVSRQFLLVFRTTQNESGWGASLGQSTEVQGATKASSTKTQTFDTQENNTNWALQNHPKRNPNYVIAEAKTKTPPKLINDPTQFDINARIQWRKNIRDHAKNWVQSQTSTPLPLLTTHSLRLTKIVFVSTLVCKVDFCSMNEFVRCDVNHILPFVMIPCVFCLEKSWYKIWCKLYGCLD